MHMPANDLVKLLSLSPLDHLNYLASNGANIKSAIVTYFFEVTIFEPLLDSEEMHKVRSRRRFQTQISEERRPLTEALDAGVTSGILEMRCQNQALIRTAAPSKLHQSFCGSVSFDSENLSGVGQEILSTVSLEFDFLGSSYAVDDAFDVQPKVVFLDGNFLGLSFMSEDFSFVEGLSDREESYFIYDLDRGSGAGDINYYLLFPSISTTASCFN